MSQKHRKFDPKSGSILYDAIFLSNFRKSTTKNSNKPDNSPNC